LETAPLTDQNQNKKIWGNLRIILYILGALLLFLLALDLLVSSSQHLGGSVAETILLATSNPFAGLFIGLLITAMLQSSSTTTSLVVAFVASGAITLESAIPIIMGANVGTTITGMIVSLGFISRKKEFRRAVAAGSYHVFFNLLTVFVLFPLEYYYSFLSSISFRIAQVFFKPSAAAMPQEAAHSSYGFSHVTDFLQRIVPNAFILVVLALVMLFGSILIFRRLISDLLKAKSPEVFSRFFFKNQIKSFSWGLLTTAAIRSSTITTSVVVPIVAKRITSLKQAAPFIMGANVGTTITAFIAATLNANTAGAISIAIAHFLFNLIGVILFFPIPVLRRLPIELASGLGKLTLQYRLIGFLFLLLTYFFIPFSLIYFNQDSIRTYHLTYEERNVEAVNHYRIVARINKRKQSGEWSQFQGEQPMTNEEPSLIYPVSVKNTTLFVGDKMFLLDRPGFCWDGADGQGRYKACIDQIVKKMELASRTFDSVYVCHVKYQESADSVTLRYYISAPLKLMLQRETLKHDTVLVNTEKLVKFEEQ
jgi:solute carrier family 34 (sodium-dependent phosphate cotransporter)